MSTPPGTIRVADRVLLRRTDFDDGHQQPAVLTVDGREIAVVRAAGRCQIVDLR